MIILNGSKDYQIKMTTGAAQSFRAYATDIEEAVEKEEVLKELSNSLYQLTNRCLGTVNKRVVQITQGIALMPIGGSAKMGVELNSDASVEKYFSVMMKAIGSPKGIVKDAFMFRINSALFHIYTEIYGIEAAKKSRFSRDRAFNLKLSNIDVDYIRQQNQTFCLQ